MVVESQRTNQIAGALTLLLLVLLLAGAVLGYAYRGKLFGAGTPENAGNVSAANTHAALPDARQTPQALYEMRGTRSSPESTPTPRGISPPSSSKAPFPSTAPCPSRYVTGSNCTRG